MTAGFLAGLHETAMGVLQAEIAAVEQELEVLFGSDVALVRSCCQHTLRAGGKRVRPSLVVLSAQCCGTPFDAARARRLAAVVETIHAATLMHDDVIDGSPLRRGQPTAAAAFGSTAAILSGDVLLSKAMRELSRDGDLDIIRLVSSAVVELAEGEVLELETRGRSDLTRDEHFRILRMKTASLLECCCRIGAKTADASQEEEDALGGFGHSLGMAFQIVDDLLDYRGRTGATGKVQATDYQEGCATLPWILYHEQASREQRSGFGHPLDAAGCEGLCADMDSAGVFESVLSEAKAHVSQGLARLSRLPESPSRELMECVAGFVVKREG